MPVIGTCSGQPIYLFIYLLFLLADCFTSFAEKRLVEDLRVRFKFKISLDQFPPTGNPSLHHWNFKLTENTINLNTQALDMYLPLSKFESIHWVSTSGW